MIILNSTNDRVEVVLGATATSAAMQCFASYRDITTTIYTPGRQLSTTNGTTPVDIVSSPSASTQRVVDYISVYNSDTGSKEVTIRFDDGTNERILYKATLGIGEQVIYQEGKGFATYTNAGALKTSLNQGNSPITSNWNLVTLGSDQTNNNAIANTWQDITGLSFPLLNGGRYLFRFFIIATTNATATGYRFALTAPSNNAFGYAVTMPTSTTATALNNSATADSTTLQTSSAVATPNYNVIEITGGINATADGTLQARFASELAGAAVVAKQGSIVEYIKVI